jgi:hypothetical protein
MKSAGFRFKVTTVISGDKFSFVCYTFVDDSDVVHSRYDTDMNEDINLETTALINEMQQVVDTWEGGLRASGGALVPSKSYWYLLHFIFEQNKWRYASIEETPGDIKIRDITGIERVPLERLEATEAR